MCPSKTDTVSVISMDIFDSRIKAICQRLETQCGRDRLSERQQSPLLEVTQELRLAVEELFVQNEELMTAREELEEERRRYRELFDFAPDCYLVTDSKGIILEANQAAAAMLGRNKQAIVGSPLVVYIDHGWRKSFLSLTYKLQKSKKIETEHCELRIQPHRHEPVPVEVTLSSIHDQNNKLIGIRWLLRDISERKKADKALEEYSRGLEELVEERTRKLADAQEALIRKEKLAFLGQLAGGVGHELRNPLASIKAAVYLLNQVLEKTDPRLIRVLNSLDREANTCERIISSLLDFARTGPPTLDVVDISRIIDEALSRVLVPESIQVVSQPDEKPPVIRADSDQLRQVFENIIVNAVQAMPEGGQLIIRSRVNEPGWVSVSFTDTGAGMPAEIRSMVFEPLFTTKARGIGLGLPIVKMLVEGHGGTIEVESEEGKGSTFSVRLPADVGSSLCPP